MSDRILLAFASGSEDLHEVFLRNFQSLSPETELFVVSEFAPPMGKWIPYQVGRTFKQNMTRVRAAVEGRTIHLTAAILQPRMPFWRMRLMPLALAPHRALFYNENLHHFMLRPRSLPVIGRHFLWRTGNFVRWELKPGGETYTFLWRLVHPTAFKRPILVAWASVVGRYAAVVKRLTPERVSAGIEDASLAEGISVVVPSRTGKELLARLLPGLLRELEGFDSEVIVVDNGSTDDSAEWLKSTYPGVTVLCHQAPMSFARAVNYGITQARYARTMLLNNDMELEAGFFDPLLAAFRKVPDLFCATAQIFFPPGQRRQETGKAVMPALTAHRVNTSFPLTCLIPLDGEDHTYVLYGSGGCSLYDTSKLRYLGGFGTLYEPAYVEDLDVGFRGWQHGWPTVYVAGAKLTHHHRTTTTRYFTEYELGLALELNYLRFLSRAVGDADLFRCLWRDAVSRLNLLAIEGRGHAVAALARSHNAVQAIEPRPAGGWSDRQILALGSGEIAIFPGRSARGRAVVVVASPYIPFPLSHGGAVRMYNLMRGAAREWDIVLLTFMDELATPPRELLEICTEIVEVRRVGSHERPLTDRPDAVEEFDRPSYRAALRQTVRKWRPSIVQLEFTQMAQYASDAAPAATVLVEHDITLDLYEQLLRQKGQDWETEQQLVRWRRFETEAWRTVDCVVTMSEKDRCVVADARRAVAIPNGVDLGRFQPSTEEPEPSRLLFLGSFAHLPNVLAVDFFLREVWPLLDPKPALHIIAGKNHRYFLDRSGLALALDSPNIEVEDFVSDVRPAYRRATLVIAPLLASAGTNIKIMEAMAMGKAIVSTPGGVNGLDELERGADVIVTPAGSDMAAAIGRLLGDPEARLKLERRARLTAERIYSWDAIAKRQSEVYRKLGLARKRS